MTNIPAEKGKFTDTGRQAALHQERIRIVTNVLPIVVDAGGVFVIAHIVTYFALGLPWQWAAMTLSTMLSLALCSLAQGLIRRGFLSTSIFLMALALNVQAIIRPVLVEGMTVMSAATSFVAIVLAHLMASPKRTRIVVSISAAALLIGIMLPNFRAFETLPIPTELQLAYSLPMSIAAVLVTVLILTWRDKQYETSIAQAHAYAAELDAQREIMDERRHELQEMTTELAIRSADLEGANRRLEETLRINQRRAALLQASTEVSRAIAQVRDMDQLLSQIAQLISRHFGFYHAGIFLIDQASGYAVLRAANSPGGQRMLARQHKLRVGSEGIVGYATGTGHPRIAFDVGDDAYYFDNPDMPDTRSEMALPLHIGDEIIGALDVQSVEEAAFVEEDVTVLTALADQVAIAIHNTRLFAQAQTALVEAEEANRRFVREEWDSFLGVGPSRQRRRMSMPTGNR